jgi:hypothetical protein
MTNATKNLDASRTEVINKLIDYNKTQNELIFATRKRLFTLEHSFRLTILAVAVLGSIIVLTTLGVFNG